MMLDERLDSVLQCSINIAKDQLEANKILLTITQELGRKR